MMSMGKVDCAESVAMPEGKSIYVSPLGDDGWSGRLPDPAADRGDGPFRTLARAVKDLKPGWTCFLRAGVYREILRPVTGGEEGRPIIFRNYLDEVAVISGADLLNGWTDEGNGIFSAPMDWNLDDQNQLFGDGAMLIEARWPHNSGSLLQPSRAKATAGTMDSLTDPALSGGEDAWKGALLWCAGGDKWICWSEKIERYDAATHTLFFKMSTPQHWYEVRPGSSYVLMGLRSSLGAPGEWWYDAGRRRMLLIPPEGTDIAKLSVEAKRRLDCIDLSGMGNVQIIGLRFRSGGVRTDEKTFAIRLSRCTGEYVAHSFLRDISDAAGVIIRGRDNQVDSCELAWSSGSILRVSGIGHRIVNCFIHDGNYGAKWSGAVALGGRRILFSHNTVKNSGRDLVSVHGLMESVVQHNDLSEAGWLTCDLGMTYGHDTDFMNTLFRFNVVHDNHAEGCAMGIYFDHCSHNAIVHDNLIYKVGMDPIRINNPSYFDLVLNNSTFETGSMVTFDHTHRDDLFGMHVIRNIFNKPINLPSHVALEGNIISADPGYSYPGKVSGNMAAKSETGAAGAFPAGRIPWKAGHDFANPPAPVWERADIDWMNMIYNSCFELETLEGWKAAGTGQADLVKGNGWGNLVLGSKTEEPTGTSKLELRLSGGPVSVEQDVGGLNADTAHVLSGWLKVSSENESVRIGIRHSDGREEWSSPVNSTTWTREILKFSTGPGEKKLTVVVSKTSSNGYACCDNLGLPRSPAAEKQKLK